MYGQYKAFIIFLYEKLHLLMDILLRHACDHSQMYVMIWVLQIWNDVKEQKHLYVKEVVE